LKILIIAVGKVKAEYAQIGCQLFVDRIRRYLPIDVIETRDIKRRNKGETNQYKAEEAAAIRAAIPKGSYVVALDEHGHESTSRKFASWIQKRRDTAVSTLVFIIGGPDGLDAELRTGAGRVMALSQLTFSHELARLLLLEQVYRAATIMAGHPYHRD
jgi:23S rRNA (pseudouridine1915-N3)-methyltransferase